MSTEGSVTQWMGAVEQGDEDAAQRLWERYYTSLLRVARSKLTPRASRAADEHDVVLDAFDACYRGLQQGRFPHIADRHELWKLLITLTARKAVDAVRREQRKKRGGGHVVAEADLAALDAGGDALARAVGHEPTPEFAATVAEDLQRRLDSLPAAALRDICLWKLEGCTNEEIAEKLRCTVRTVERKLELIRKLWLEGPHADGVDKA